MLLVCWQAPPTDASSKSCGFTVTGYQLFVNGEPRTTVDGASQTKVKELHVATLWAHLTVSCVVRPSPPPSQVLLAGLDLSQPQSLGIATCTQEGRISEVMSINYMYMGHSRLSVRRSYCVIGVV